MVARLALVTLLALGSTAGAKEMPAPTPEEEVLHLINHYRAAAGLPQVTLDATASAGCAAHATYMRLNRDTDAMVGLHAHQQDPALPGASPAGAACGKAADLFPGVSDLPTAVDGFMAGLYHRRPILSPELARIGVGYAALPDGTLMAAVMFINAPTPPPAAQGWPVAYPGRDQQDVPLAFGLEIPNPIPGGGHLGGYPITLQFPPFDKVTDVAVELVDAKGTKVPVYLSTPEAPATSFGQYGVICAIPRTLLDAGARYTVKVSAMWAPGRVEPRPQKVERTWSFTTIGLRKIAATDEAGLLAAVGKPSLVRGTVKYAAMMDSATAFLSFEVGKPKGYELVSVIVPLAIWQTLARGAAPGAWIGRTLDVEATPQLVKGKYLNLAIVLASQLRAVDK
ncbi:MAG: CAP domain-containing protein [Proteobacteria bacterium]|nr:CAP domain-containing protein [Pseudomonadota bacterium]